MQIIYFLKIIFEKEGLYTRKKVHMDHPLDPSSPLVDLHGQFGNPLPLTRPRGLWMTPNVFLKA